MQKIEKLRPWASLVLGGFLIAGCVGQPGAAPTATQAATLPPEPTLTQPLAATLPPAATLPIPATGITPTPQSQETQAGAAPSCTPPASPTVAMTEGPYYTSGSPERTNLLEPGVPGEKLTLSGWVLTPDCQPVSGALVDFWQADGEGRYDNAGYVLRGHQFTDENGRYELVTVVPGEYPGRTEHIHVKVQAPGGPVLTSQVFFPGEAANETDRIFDPGLLVTVLGREDGMQAQFNFIVTPQ